jgi:photosystem II stability/assembly factor-like uncharacterized protein
MNIASDEPDPVYALAATPNGTLFAGRRSGLFIAANGTGWTSLPVEATPSAASSITALAVMPQGDAVFVGGYGYVARLTASGALQRVSVLPRPLPLVTALVVSPDYARDGVVLAGTAEDGVFRSIDHGEHWAPWNIGLLDHRIIDLALSPAFAVDDTVFAATETGVFSSVNGGRSWRMSAFPRDDDPALCLAASPCSAQDVTVYAGTEGGALLVSRDKGRSWCEMPGVATDGQPINALVCIDATTLIAGLADRLLLIEGILDPCPRVVQETACQSITALTCLVPAPDTLVAIVGSADGQITRLRLR